MPEQVNKRGPNGEVNGSCLLEALSTTELTDGAAMATLIVPTQHVKDLVIDVVSDKGGSVVVTPLPDHDDTSVLGEASTTGTLTNGGPSGRFKYSDIAAPNTKVVFTKTEAGTTDGFTLSVRGQG